MTLLSLQPRQSLSRLLQFVTLACVCGLWSVCGPLPANAGNPNGAFQVTIEILEVVAPNNQNPPDRHLVLFKDGKAYDFALTAPRDVTVIDPLQGKVTLLSRDKHVKTTIAHQDIVMASTRVKAYAKKEGIEQRLGIGAQPAKGKDKEYDVSFAGFRYNATAAKPTAPLQPVRFAEFTDWVARVNLIRKLGSPPFARMALGRSIAADGLVPSTIMLDLNQARTLKSNYTFKDGLSKENQVRIEKVAGMIALYQEVPLEAFPR